MKDYTRYWMFKRRKSLGQSQKQIAAKAGISDATYCRYENGSRGAGMTVLHLMKIAYALNLSCESAMSYEAAYLRMQAKANTA